MDFLKRFANKAKVKYGAILAGFLAIVITIIILLNVLITTLGNRFNWFFDMTDEDRYSVSEEFVNSMSKIDKDINIEIVFLQDRDYVENDLPDANGPGLSYVHTTATHLASRLPNVSVSYHSKDDRPFMAQFDMSQQNGKKLGAQDVIIMRTTEPGKVDGFQFDVLNESDFYFSASDGSLYAYNGEARIIESAIKLTTDKLPSVYFVTNHGGDNPVDSFSKLFENAGLNCELINLAEKRFTCECGEVYLESYLRTLLSPFDTEEEKDANGNTIFLKKFVCKDGCQKEQNVLTKDLKKLSAIPENARAVIIYEPQTDFTDDEILLLESYQKAKGNVMTFLDASIKKENMRNYYEWLETWGGITINTDAEGFVTDELNSFNEANTSILTKVPNNDATAVFLPGLSGAPDHFIVTEAVTITIKDNREEGDNTLTETLPILTTTSDAKYGTGFDSKKQHVIMSLSKRGVFLENPDAVSIAQDDFTSCLLVCTSGSFVDNDHIVDTRNSNEKIVTALIAATTDAQIYSTNVEFKTFNDYSLTITGSQKITVLVLSMTVIPLISLIAGFVVIYRRKRR